MINSARTILVLDEDPSIGNGIARLGRMHGWDVIAPNCAGFTLDPTDADMQRFLAMRNPCCVVFDVSTLEKIMASGYLMMDKPCQKIGIGHPGYSVESVNMVRTGLTDFIPKPFRLETIRLAIEQALQRSAELYEYFLDATAVRARFQNLTRRESEVCAFVVEGLQNKEIAENLGISIKTVKVHRANLMAKIGAGSLVELLRQYDVFKGVAVRRASMPRVSSHINVSGSIG